jgi:hypothetical protein
VLEVWTWCRFQRFALGALQKPREGQRVLWRFIANLPVAA